MNKLFKQWADNLIPVALKLDEKGKKLAYPYKWQNGETYTDFNKNSVGMRTGKATVNVVDVDTKDLDKLTEPFKSWVMDRLMFEDTFIVETANGYHLYFDPSVFTLRSTTKIGANKSTIDFIDFRGEGGMVFVSSKTDFANYDVICSEAPTKDIGEIIAYLPPYEETTTDEDGFTNLDDETDTEVTVANDNGDTPLEHLSKLLELTPSDCDRDTWMQMMASAYNMNADKEAVINMLRDWSKTADNYTEGGFDSVINQLRNGKFGKAFKGGTLVNRAIEEKVKKVTNKIEHTQNSGELNKIFVDKGEWKSYPRAKEDDFETVAKAYQKKGKEFKGSNVPIKEAREIVFFEDTEVTVEEKKQLKDVQLYLDGKDFYIRHKNTLSKPLTKAVLKDTVGIWGLSQKVFNKAFSKTKPIQSIKRETKYIMQEQVEFVAKKSDNPSELEHLYVYTNPYYGVEQFKGREDIVEDFFTNIWKGKAEDILRIIGLTIRFEETKLNKIHVVAPSNTGKTTFLENVGFQTIHMKRLIQALNADKGIGKGVVNGLKSSGFLLIDETNKALTQEIKNIDNYIYVDQFGEGGTQEIKLHFTCMTSTHKTAIRGMSDEMYNRLMLVELNDMGYPLEKSDLFINENAMYTKTITEYAKWTIKDALFNPDYKPSDLHRLQAKYRLELNDDVDEMLTEISEDILEEYKSLATEDGLILERNGDYYIRRKSDLVDAIEDRMGEYSNIDKGKYADELVKHFLGDAKAKNIKVHAKSIKYYPMKMKKYYPSDEAEIIDEFDDLETDFQ